MFHFLSKILSFVTAPYHWIMVCLILAVALKSRIWKRRMFFLTLLLYVVFGNKALINMVYTNIEPVALLQQDITSPYAYAVVLGGGFAYTNNKYPDRIFFRNHVNRLTECMELYQSGKIKKVIFSGGIGGLTKFKDIETEHIRTFLIENNWPDSSILVESTSRNTFENALNVKAILDSNPIGEKILLITSALHMPRAAGCFKKQGINFDVYPADYQQKDKLEYLDYILPGMDAVHEWDAIFHEWIGYMVYKWKGYL